MASSHRPSIYRIADAVMLVLSQPSTKVECPAASFECCIYPKWWRKANLRTVCSALVYPETGAIWPGSQVPGSGLQEIHQTRHPSCVTARVFALPMEFTDDKLRIRRQGRLRLWRAILRWQVRHVASVLVWKVPHGMRQAVSTFEPEASQLPANMDSRCLGDPRVEA